MKITTRHYPTTNLNIIFSYECKRFEVAALCVRNRPVASMLSHSIHLQLFELRWDANKYICASEKFIFVGICASILLHVKTEINKTETKQTHNNRRNAVDERHSQRLFDGADQIAFRSVECLIRLKTVQHFARQKEFQNKTKQEI